MADRQIIEADLTWTGARFERGVRIAVDEAGTITQVGSLGSPPTLRLTDRALLPGFVNAHSHAFQRGLRGHGERFPGGTGSFWTWRDAMYQLVQSMDEEKFYRLSLQAFQEMLAAGITTVGEFHYLHHVASNTGFSLDEVLLRAAGDAGIRIVLLNTYYKTGGIDRPLTNGQLRFRVDSPEQYWEKFDQLASRLERPGQSLGVAAHSIRAVPVEEIGSLHQEATRRHLVFHMHVEEQAQEIEDCVRAYGKPPMALLNEQLVLNPMFTAVHCTHTAAADLDEFLNAGGNVCLCPLTEANLGDGVPNVSRILKSHARIALGTDSNARISMTEEMRWLEYVQRLSARERGICRDSDGHVARKLLEMATGDGARALGLRVGRIEPGCFADVATIDLTAPALAEWTEDSLLESFIFGTDNEAIADVFVGGKRIKNRRVAP